MKKIKDIWNNKELRCGGYYELAMEVSSNKEIEPVKELTKQVFQCDFVHGPFNSNFELVELDLEYFDNLGYIEIEDKKVPFKTFNVPEEGNEGSNWLDICVYTAIYEEIFGDEYQTWSTEGKWHKGYDNQLIRILNRLNSIYKIRIGVIGFEISGMYYLQNLRHKELTENDVSHTKFFVNKDEDLKSNNWNMVTQLVTNE